MNIINAKIWSAALRSGDWLQARGNLQVGTRFCCLGVAHQCLNLSSEISETESYPSIRAALGIDEVEGGKFVAMNDEGGKSFLQIADYIDAQIAAES